MLNLDTNVLLAFAQGKLRRDEERVLSQDAQWAISAIVLWELAKLSRSGVTRLDLDSKEFRDTFDALRVLPNTLEIARVSQRLDFDADPADELIAATSIFHGAPLVTRDSKLLASRVVPLAVR